MVGTFICKKSGQLNIRCAIPYNEIVNNEHIKRYYSEVIDSITEIEPKGKNNIHGVTEIRMKPECLSKKSSRKRVIAQWLILDLTEREGVVNHC